MIDAAVMAQIGGSSRAQIEAVWASALPKVPIPNLSLGNLRKALAYELQVKRQGALSAKSEQALGAYFAPTGGEAALRASTELQPGATLIREWNGRRYVVDVLAEGFGMDGRSYKSLSQIAQAITGTHWSGPRFFGLTKACPNS